MYDETLAADDQSDRPGFSLPAVFIGLSVKQLCALTAAHVVFGIGLVGLGAWLQAAWDDDRRSGGHPALHESIAEKDRLISERNDGQRTSDDAAAVLRSAAAERQALEGKAAFLERFLTYRVAPTEASKALLVDHICALWRQTENFRIHMDQAPVDITADELRNGLSQDISNYLVRGGVPESFLKQAQGARSGQASSRTFQSIFASSFLATPSVSDEVVDRILKQAHELRAVKAIHFHDGTVYQVPQEIALAVHSRSDCAPF